MVRDFLATEVEYAITVPIMVLGLGKAGRRWIGAGEAVLGWWLCLHALSGAYAPPSNLPPKGRRSGEALERRFPVGGS